MSDIIIKARGITKRWSGVVALDNVDFNIYPGKINVVMGENGAGKSTLMNIISGAYSDYEGQLFLDNAEISFRNTAEANGKGISMIHQELYLIPYLSVAENIFLGREPVNKFGLIDYRRMHSDAAEILQRLKFTGNTHSAVKDLRVGEQQLVEIAKALSFNVKALIMDEPTSSLSENETRTLFALIDELAAKGVGIVYITHKMNELRRLADFVTVLRDGKLLGEYPAADITDDEIIHLMAGRDKKDFFVRKVPSLGKKALELQNISVRKTDNRRDYRLKNINLHVCTGEALGIYGLMGAGRTELFEAIFGVNSHLRNGKIKIFGEDTEIESPREAIDNGVALIPEDRKNDGLVLEMNICGNTTLAALNNAIKFGLLHNATENAIAESFRNRLAIKTHSVKQLAGKLSGGNQQKVALSKWLLTKPRILLLDEPTRGIDVNAKNEIYKLINELTASGLAIIIVSSELPEIMAVSDRILTICNGVITGEFTRDGFNEEDILKKAMQNEN